jgi:hypothetical protein
MERAKRLPAPEEQPKYAVVDAGGARLSLWQNGRKVDEMKVVVGKAETATPMMAAYIKFASVNPYWNVPPELAGGQLPYRSRISGPDRLQRQSENHRSHNGGLAGGCRRKAGRATSPPPQPRQFNGHDEVHAA